MFCLRICIILKFLYLLCICQLLGEIFKAYGHYQEAQVHFRHTLDLHPGYEPALKLLKELEEMPLTPWQSYTYFIIGGLVSKCFE